jgi:hypothetical protein
MERLVFARLPLLLLALSLALSARAQTCGANASSTISTDRPQITNSSVVVPCGSLQFENGFQQIGSAGRQGFDLPETSIRFGIASKTELRLGVPDYFHNTDTGSAFASGAGDLLIGLKQQLGPAHGYDASVQVPWSRSLTKVWALSGQLALFDPTQGAQRNVTGQAAIYFDRALGSVWDAYVEYAGEFAQRGGPQHTVDFGAAYKISPHQQLDLHCNFGFAAALPTHAIGAGYSVRFQVIHAKK